MSGIYIHIPFCKQACYYCDFHFSTSLKSKDKLIVALIKEIELRKSDFPPEIYSLYIGGGTPSLLKELVSGNNLENIFDDVMSVEEVKKYKPHPDVYNLPIKKYQIEKNQFVYLSANTWDVSAAGNYGYNSVWVNRNKNIFDNLDYQPLNEIHDLSELLEII